MKLIAPVARYLPWIVLVVVLIPLIIAYFSDTARNMYGLYGIFPLFGLVAWSLMCTQYIAGAIRILRPNHTQNYTVFTYVSEVAVLVSILAHPLLFAVQRYLDSGLLPPGSLRTYVGAEQAVFITIGFVALTAFLAYDVLKPKRELLRNHKAWGFISLTQVIAMIFIFIHALALGGMLAEGWPRVLWILLNIILLPCYALHLYYDFGRTLGRKPK